MIMAGFSETTINLKPGEGMYGAKDPGEMTPEERVRELAEILARGYLRLWGNAKSQDTSTAKPGDENAATSDISNGCDVDKSAS